MNQSNPISDDRQFYIRFRGRTLGPFGVEKLMSLRARGQFSRAHEVSTDKQHWSPASILDEILAPAQGAPQARGSANRVANEVASRNLEEAPAKPSMPGANWHFNIGGELNGPVSIVDLRAMIHSGKLHTTDFVWKDGMPEWVPISQIPELQPPPQSAPPMPLQAAPQLHYDGIHRTSGLAVASLVMGIIGLVTPFFVFNLLATVFGAASLKAIARSTVPLGGRGMALSGLILGILGLAFWAIFILFWFGWLAVVISAFGMR